MIRLLSLTMFLLSASISLHADPSAPSLEITPADRTADLTPVTVRMQFPDSLRPGEPVQIELLSPQKSFLFTTEYPHSEEKTLLFHTVKPDSDASLRFTFLPPIRGSYSLKASVPDRPDMPPLVASFSVGENSSDTLYLALFLAALFAFGYFSASLFTGEKKS